MEHKDHLKRKVKGRVENYVTKAFKILFFIVLGIALIFLIGYVFMSLWNWLLPSLFGAPTLGYWQAVGLLILAKMIFGFGFGKHKDKHNKKAQRLKHRKCKDKSRRDFSDWTLYDQFWEEEGQEAFKNYVHRKQDEEETP